MDLGKWLIGILHKCEWIESRFSVPKFLAVMYHNFCWRREFLSWFITRRENMFKNGLNPQ
jgi:hypothetical protein